MFSSTNDLQIEKTEVHKLSESKKNGEHIKNTEDKSKALNSNNNDNITTIVIKPNNNIPKTIYYKRLCQKLVQQNKTIESKKQKPYYTENTNIVDKIIQDKNEELNNNEKILKETKTSLVHDESKNILNSTLVICESDVAPSDCELDTTPVIQCDNQEKDKSNVSIEPFFSNLKQPAKLKNKFIITPATIGVHKTIKCAEKLNHVTTLASITQCNITNSPEKQVINSLNKNTQITCTKDNIPEGYPKTDIKSLTKGILHNQQSFTSEKNNQTQSLNIEVEQCQIRRKRIVLVKDGNTHGLSNVKKSPSVTCMSSSIDNKLNTLRKNDKCLTMSNDRESSSSSKNTSVETILTNKTVIPSNNNEVEQIPISRKMNVLKRDDNLLNKFNKVAQSSFIKDHKTKYDSKPDDKTLSTDTIYNKKLSTCKNNNNISSFNIEVEQFPIKRRKTVMEKDNNNFALSNMIKRSRVTCLSPSTDEFNMSTNNVKCLSMNNDKQSSSSSKNTLVETSSTNKTVIASNNNEIEQFQIKQKKRVIEKDNNSLALSNMIARSQTTCLSVSTDEFNMSTNNVKCLSMNNDRQSSSPSQQKNNQSKYNSDKLECGNNITESKCSNNSSEISSINTSVETSPNKTVMPSINIEVEQGFIFKRTNARKVIMHSTSGDNKQETKKGRRVQLITIQDHYSKPVSSFNGAKKTEIDVSKKSILTEREVESSSQFYVPQVKRRRTINFGSSDS